MQYSGTIVVAFRTRWYKEFSHSFIHFPPIFIGNSSAYAIMERLWNGTEEGRLVRVHNLVRSWDSGLNLNELKDCSPERDPTEG